MNSTPTNTARTELHSMITLHHANTRGSRAGRLSQDCTSLCPQYDCRRCVMSHSLPHLTLTTSTSSLSLASPIFQTVSPTHARSLVDDPYLPCDVPRQGGGSTQIPSLTGCEPKPIEFKNMRLKRSSLKNWSPEKLSLTGILGQIRTNYRKDS